MTQPLETNSLEVRWFDNGSPPPELRDWITDLGDVAIETRTDQYFSPPSPSFNLKLRTSEDPRIELKRQLGVPQTHAFSDLVTGRVEQWYRWSFSLDEAPTVGDYDPTGLWIPVEKTRVLCPVTDDIPHGEREISDVQGHVELSEVTIMGETGWTCCVEVAGNPASLETAFISLASELFSEDFPIPLSESDSYGYSAWIGMSETSMRANPEVLLPSNR